MKVWKLESNKGYMKKKKSLFKNTQDMMDEPRAISF